MSFGRFFDRLRMSGEEGLAMTVVEGVRNGR